ncbi:MAG: SUMF1/EgtB/PvdO family nonheme iron enzyme [Planctomycetes bacterium]|nr:SUMF1/EgtB/PvdO family nonheme iron enzyme [Planctomycetota bacterium]
MSACLVPLSGHPCKTRPSSTSILPSMCADSSKPRPMGPDSWRDQACCRPVTAMLLGAIVLMGLIGCALGAEAACCRKSRTWHDTMIAAREALTVQERSKADHACFKTYTSEVVRGGEEARKMTVPIAGVDELFLYVTGAPEVVYGAATWADPKLIDAQGQETLVCHMEALKVEIGRHDIDRNLKAGVSGPLAIAGRGFEHGIHVYAPAKIRIRLDQPFDRLEAWVGIDDWVGPHGAVRFHVTDAAGAKRMDLWTQLALDFSHSEPRRQMKWEREDRILDADWAPGDFAELARRYAQACHRIPSLAEQATAMAPCVRDQSALEKIRGLYYRSRKLDAALSRARSLNIKGLRLAIQDLMRGFDARYADGASFLKRLCELESALCAALKGAEKGTFEDQERVDSLVGQFDELQREALMANPHLDFDKLLLIRRVPHGDPRRPHGRGYGVGEYIGLPRQSSKCNPNIEQPFQWDNEIAVLSLVSRDGQLTTVYKSEGRRLITDVDLHWDADQMLLSMPGSHDKWHVFEIGTDGTGLRQLTPTDQPDIHFYDSCYLPNGDIAFVSTAPLQGVPCNAGVIVGMMYLMDGDGGNIRQICFEQDHTYCPTVMNDGRILYLRWDYTDTPHVWNRILFSMNPDGTGQTEYYGSNSYWPNSVFYARPVPNHTTRTVGIVTGHHVGRVGELVIFDSAKGQREADGVVQRIPGYGEDVEPLIEDKLTEHSWPKFVHPYPLSERHFIVSCKPTPDSLWGIYLVDIYDNMVLLKEEEGHVLVEPIPLRRTDKPPVLASRTKPDCDDAVVYMEDVYAGPGLTGISRGTVQALRVFTYHFGYQKLAGINHRIGADGPWEVKRVLGTVPVEADGSALFRIPAKTPISVQPLDAEGKAIQLMRSWMTAMPGETLSCVGCHEHRNSSPPSMSTVAATRKPSEIQPWYGPVRGFSFKREVQPVLDRYCIGCHNGSPRRDGRVVPNLRGNQDAYHAYRHGDPDLQVLEGVQKEDLMSKYKGIFEPSYIALRSRIRTGGLESDLHLLPPKEFHADTSELVQMLKKGHQRVELDREAWDRIITWIDLNAPCHGTWTEFTPISGDQRERRCELREMYGGVVEDGEDIPQFETHPIKRVVPRGPRKPMAEQVRCRNWPFDVWEARKRQAAGSETTRTIDLAGGVTMELTRIPAGGFVMGDPDGERDELPISVVTFDKPFWMGSCEVTNRQYAQFDPAHDSRFEHRTSWIFSEEYLGWSLDGPEQPVVRVSWQRAVEFCQWLSQKTGLRITLPTEAQWEYACRAGSDLPLWYGDLDADFSTSANMADHTMRDLAFEGWRPRAPDLVPREARFDDGKLVTADVGSYRANPWGLFDMHGNVWEWTRTEYRSYPYQEDDGRNDIASSEDRVVRGGSWYDRPKRCRSGFRLSYPPYQRVFNVGFRIVCEEKDATVVAANTR